MLRNILFISLVGLSRILYAQSTYERGYVVTNAGETIEGEINYNWAIKANRLSFKRGSLTQVYDVEELSSFKIENGDLYLRKQVVLDVSPTDLEEMLVVGQDTFSTQNLFVKALVLGSANLYQSYDEPRQRYHYFIETAKSNGTIELIENRRKINLDEIYEIKIVTGLVKTQDKFKGQLSFLMSDCAEVSGYIQEMESLDQNSIIDLFQQYNNCENNEASYAQIKELRNSGVSLGVTAGAQLFDIKPESAGLFPDDFDVDPQFSPTVGIEAVFSFRNRRSFGMSLTAFYSQFGASKTFFEDRAVLSGFSTITYDWQQITTHIKTHFKIGLGDRFVFLTPGFGVNLLFNGTGTKDFDTGSQTEILNESIDRQLIITMGAGYQFKRFRAALDYDLGGSSKHFRFGHSKAINFRFTYLLLR